MGFAQGYNDRLFTTSHLRSSYHLSRYRWLVERVAELNIPNPRIIELGCFDAKTLDFLSSPPSYYLGLDANWENGLAIGRSRWAGHQAVELIECHQSNDIPDRGMFDIGICMETLEHMSYELAESYIAAFSKCVRHLLIVAPREHGLVFLAKHSVKRVMGWPSGCTYTFKDFAALSLGLTRLVPHDDHKGYDERCTIRSVQRHFNVERVEGIFPPFVPNFLCFSIGIVASGPSSSQRR